MTRFLLPLLAALWALPATAEEAPLSVEALLDLPAPHTHLDGLPTAERAAQLANLAHWVIANGYNKKATQTLCAITPWDTDDKGLNDRLQNAIWAKMRQYGVNDDAYRWLDCAAVNRTDFYRDKVYAPMYTLRQTMCAQGGLAEGLGETLVGLAADIASVDTAITKGLRGADNADRYSFYPLRNVNRWTVVRAGRAVHLARDNWAAAQTEFARIAADLEQHLNTLDFANTRSAWRFHDDLIFYRTFYAWLGQGEGRDKLDMSELINWKPVLGGSLPDGALPDQTAQAIRVGEGDKAAEYMEKIYLERLLPGAQPVPQECPAWRQRYYDIGELARKFQDCATEPLTSFEDLVRLDSCILEYEASDWRMQFMTINDVSDEITSAQKVVQEFINRILADERIKNSENFANISVALSAFQAFPLRERSLVVLQTDNTLTTSDRHLLIKVIHDGEGIPLPWNTRPLFSRPKLY